MQRCAVAFVNSADARAIGKVVEDRMRQEIDGVQRSEEPTLEAERNGVDLYGKAGREPWHLGYQVISIAYVYGAKRFGLRIPGDREVGVPMTHKLAGQAVWTT